MQMARAKRSTFPSELRIVAPRSSNYTFPLEEPRMQLLHRRAATIALALALSTPVAASANPAFPDPLYQSEVEQSMREAEAHFARFKLVADTLKAKAPEEWAAYSEATSTKAQAWIALDNQASRKLTDLYLASSNLQDARVALAVRRPRTFTKWEAAQVAGATREATAWEAALEAEAPQAWAAYAQAMAKFESAYAALKTQAPRQFGAWTAASDAEKAAKAALQARAPKEYAVGSRDRL